MKKKKVTKMEVFNGPSSFFEMVKELQNKPQKPMTDKEFKEIQKLTAGMPGLSAFSVGPNYIAPVNLHPIKEVKKKPKNCMFMRFYSHTEKECETFLKGLKKKHPLLKSFEKGTLTHGINPCIPYWANAMEYNLHFASKKDMVAFHADQSILAKYQKFESMGVAEARKPTDLAFEY